MYNKKFPGQQKICVVKPYANEAHVRNSKAWLRIEETLQNKQLAGVNVIVSGRVLSKPQQCFLWREKERNEVSKAPVEKRAT